MDEFVYNAAGQRATIWNGNTKTVIQGQYYWGGKRVAYYNGGSLHFQHQDWMGTEHIRSSYNGGGDGQFTSLPFGDDLTTTGGTDTDAYHFAQIDHDYETDTEHAQFRQYSSAQGRFLSPDPYGGSYDPSNPQSFNRYAYVMNNPLSFIDPNGLMMLPPPIDLGEVCWEYGVCAEPDSESGEGSSGGGGRGAGATPPAPDNGTTNSTCQATLLNMANQQLGTNFNSSNIAGSYTNGTAYNIIIQSNQLTAAQFNNIQQGRYTTSGWQYLTGVGLAGHIADETNLGFAQSAFQSSNIGGNYSVSFAFHDDHGYANNPIGALIHWITDVLGHNTRKPC